MAFVVQDDTGEVAGANAYITVQEFRDFHADRGVLFSKTDTEIQVGIVRATDYVDVRYKWSGCPKAEDQTTVFPRYDDVIPTTIKSGTALLAAIVVNGGSLFLAPPTSDPSGRLVKEKLEKVGPILEKTVYDTGQGLQYQEFPEADMYLRNSGYASSRHKEVLRW